MISYIIKADGIQISREFDFEKALRVARKYEYECYTQEESFKPRMEIIKDEIN